MKTPRILLFMAVLSLLGACSKTPAFPADALVLRSPDTQLELRFAVVDGVPQYALSRAGEAVILPSRLGYTLIGRDDLPEGLKFEIIETPGHTQGCVCLYLPGQDLMFCGDTIFRGAVGRTDHPGGDHDQMIESIKRSILPLPPQTRLLPGHGPETTIGEEIAANPFLQ